MECRVVISSLYGTVDTEVQMKQKTKKIFNNRAAVMMNTTMSRKSQNKRMLTK
jgi:hypothetical protein